MELSDKKNPFQHFYRHSYAERLKIIQQFGHLSTSQIRALAKRYQARSNGLVENYVTDYALPEGIAVGLRVNGQLHAVPMVVEEPSVIAAASNGAQMLSRGTGIRAKVLNRLLTGQIILQLNRPAQFKHWLDQHQRSILRDANAAHPTIKKYGGGARQCRLRELGSHVYSLDLLVDVSEAMGANIVNSMLEAVAAVIDDRFPRVTLMSILSNYADHSLVQVKGVATWSKLATPQMDGHLVAQRIALASRIAQLDIYRAATHNKGIMNGVDAVTIAMGNDWRAVESGAQAYAARSGRYRGLSQWHVTSKGLVGMLTMPLALGFVGGATRVLPLVKINQQIAGVHSARDLMKLTAAVGLAQNLAALRAIVTDGIQRGHMALQMRSLAISSGANSKELPLVVSSLRRLKKPDLQQAKQIIKKIRLARKQMNR